MARKLVSKVLNPLVGFIFGCSGVVALSGSHRSESVENNCLEGCAPEPFRLCSPWAEHLEFWVTLGRVFGAQVLPPVTN